MRDLAALPTAHLHVHLESTVRPGTARELADALRAAGLTVTPSTDVPAETDWSLPAEYAAVRDVHGWDDASLADLARASVTSSFAPPPVRRRLHAGIDAWLGGPA